MLTLVEKVLVLADLPLLAEVRSEDLAQLAQAARIDDYETRETVYSEGEPIVGLHVLVAGAIELRRKSKTLPVTAGQAFGTLSLFDNKPSRYAAFVTEPSSILTLERKALHDLLSDHLSLATGLLHSLASRLREAEQGKEREDDDMERDLG